MSDFGRAKYVSYVALCKKLRLKREFQTGDWYLWEGAICLFTPRPANAREGYIDPEAPGNAIWLPTLSDWLEMVGPEGVRMFAEYTLRHFGLTPEEVAARLWVKVESSPGPASALRPPSPPMTLRYRFRRWQDQRFPMTQQAWLQRAVFTLLGLLPWVFLLGVVLTHLRLI